MANNPHDNLRMLQLIRRQRDAHGRHLHGRHRHAVADPGRQVRRTVHLRHVPSRTGAGPGPAQLPADEGHLHYDSINAETEVYGVIADPDRPQPEPADPQRGLSRTWSLNSVYVPFRVPREDLATLHARTAASWASKGLSVTIPHKEPMHALI